MHEISPVTLWLHDLKGIEKPPPCGAGQKLPRAAQEARPRLVLPAPRPRRAGEHQASPSPFTALVIYK